MDKTGYLARIGELTEPGERVLAHAKATVAGGVTPPPPPDPAPAPASGPISPGAVVLNLVDPLVSSARGDRLVDRIVWGVAGRGAPGSAASRLHRAVQPDPALHDIVLAVTDRRLLACLTGPLKLLSSRDDDARAVAEMQVAWAAPRSGVAAARVGWHRLNPKRLRIVFTDGSWLAFTVPIAESGRPLRTVAAALAD
ncbi:hypothetical protein GCM10010399_53140 [Dactylosporangium fulvum]|uniref:Uncharacterized protein n=1 Tax=Dactylosporangium fulvum TaxID=53359 RepID=A0ABY5VMT2_9ACTN|nr:hypothetical protein [Dactylosporangium fulvum]UWP79027.1 hypothetical protein Dfulv_28100 [Dactylosporangium fulvum]